MANGSALIRTALRGVGRRSRGSGGGIRIRQVELVRYVGPGRALVHSHGMVVWLRTGDGEVSRCGIGEAVAAPAQAAAAWRRLRELGAGLVGSVAPGRVDPARPLDGIEGWQPVRPVDSGAVRAAKLALEIALLDLLMNTGALPAAGAVEPAPLLATHRLPKVSPGAPADDLTQALREDDGTAWAVRLRLTGDTALDLAWLRHTAGLDRAAGRNRPLWLVGGDRAPAAAHELVARVSELIGAGEAPARVLLEEPLERKPQSSLAKYQERSALSKLARRSQLCGLQQAADEALGRPRSGPVAGPRLAIVAGDSLSAVNQVQRLVDGWPVGGLHLSLARWGTLAGFHAAARIAKAHDPSTLVLLGGGRGSGLTATAMQWLATVTPEIDRYVPEVPAVPWPRLALAGEPGSGLFAGVDLAELATVADEVATFPHPPRPPAGEAPNRFPDHPLPGEAVGRRSMLLETEALRAGLRTLRLSRDVFLAEEAASGRVIGFSDSESSATGEPASISAARKGVTRDLLAARGLPVPEGASFGPPDQPAQYEAAYAQALRFGFPLVVKPAGGTKGVAVTIGIDSERQLRRALDEVASSRYAGTGVVVERFVTGTDYRVLATRSEVLSVVRREPASVVGDGRRSIEELALAANAARRQNPHLGKRVITLDARVDEQLDRQGLTRRSVPEAGRRVRLRAEANFSLGGESYEVRDTTHPSVCELAVAAVAAVPGLPHAGLDILMEDHQVPAGEQDITIIEVNSRPVQAIHHFPMYGPPRDVSRRLLRDAAEAGGMALTPPADELTVKVTVTGRVQAVGYRRWMVRAAKQLGVSGWVANAVEPDRVQAIVHGKAAWVGMMLRLAYDGPPGAAVVEVSAEPVDVAPANGFTIHPDAPR